MNPRFHESEVEEAALQWFGELGYEILYGPEIEPDGAHPERTDYADPLLHGRLRAAMSRINPDLPREAIDEAYRKLTSTASPSLIENNQTFHRYLTDGITVEYRGKKGTLRHGIARIIDSGDPANNDWVVVNQFTVKGPNRPRRPDVVVFINGLPVAVIELKNPGDEEATIWKAFNDLQTYKQQIPALFTTNELLIISDGVEARIGSLTANEDWFTLWRTVDGNEIAPATSPGLEVLLRGLFAHDRLAEYLKNFILFESDGNRAIKKIAGYHQFFAVQEAVKSTVIATSPEGNQKCGVIWHTQGSGKSLTMVFYARKIILHPEMENPTLVVLTDENDLDNQLFDTFSHGSEHLRQNPIQATSRKNLRELLQRESGGIIFSTVQKFFPEKDEEEHPLLSDRHNIIFIADEAHRSQYGFQGRIDKETGYIRYGFAEYIRQALPNASSIGFTGTPISLKDRDTQRVFGDYIGLIYDVVQAQEDGVVVPIYYEGRHVRLSLPEELKPKIDEGLDDITEGEEEETKERLKSKWAQLEAIVGTERRIDIIAEDIVSHFEKRREALDGKAMIVCMSRRICAEMYSAIIRLRPEWEGEDDTSGVVKVVMSGSKSDEPAWQMHFRSKAQRNFLRNRFVNPDDPFRLVIVRDMWNTGFNAPCLHTMYVDKPMQGHGLMQTIARVNRVFRDKPGGLIVDYLGIAPRMRTALAEYTVNKKRALTVEEIEDAVQIMCLKHEVCCDFLHGFDWSIWTSGDPGQRLALIPAAMEHILAQKDGKKQFLDAVTGLSAAFALVVPHEAAETIRVDVAFFQTIRASIIKSTSRSGKASEALNIAVNQLISEAITPEGPIDIFQLAGLDRPDISILSDEFLAEVRDLPQKNLAIELLRKLIDDRIRANLKRNVVQSRRLSEMLEKSIREYENRSVETAIIIEELIHTAQEVRNAVNRGEQMGLTDAEVAFYDALADNETARQVMADEDLRKISCELVEAVRKSVTIDWALKESVRARIRVIVKRILNRYGYPPDKGDEATRLVLMQAERLCGEIAGG